LAFGYHLRRKLKRGELIQAVGDDCTFKFPIHPVGSWRKSVGRKAVKRLHNFFELTKHQAAQRVAILRQIRGLSVIVDDAGGEGVWPFVIILMPNEKMRDAVLDQLWQKALGVGRLFIHAIKDYDYLAEYVADGSTPNAQDFAARTLIMTNSLWLKDKDFLKIRDVLVEQLAKGHEVNVQS
jgi:dTDP-4-amino-4,6-dideoxygalactose transaminase